MQIDFYIFKFKVLKYFLFDEFDGDYYDDDDDDDDDDALSRIRCLTCNMKTRTMTYWEQCSIARVARIASFKPYYDVKH